MPEEIEAAEFELIRKTTEELNLPDRSLLTEWYERDENAVPPVYYLRRRLLKDGIDYTQFAIWSTRVEIPLRELLTTCANAIPFSEPQSIQYERSLTEREILAGALNSAVADAKDHVYAYFREVEVFDQLASAADSEASELRKFVDFADATQ